MYNLYYWCYLERAEGEVDKVPSIATASVYTFIYQHSEDYFMDSKQRNQHQCCSGQAKVHKQIHVSLRMSMRVFRVELDLKRARVRE